MIFISLEMWFSIVDPGFALNQFQIRIPGVDLRTILLADQTAETPIAGFVNPAGVWRLYLARLSSGAADVIVTLAYPEVPAVTHFPYAPLDFAIYGNLAGVLA